MTARRELQLAVLLCLVGSALVLLAVGQTWVVSEDGADLTIRGTRTEVAGTELATGVRALGLLGLAAVVAVAATRRWGRLLVGLVTLAAGVGVVVQVAGTLDRSLTNPAWAWLALSGGLVLALAGLLVTGRGPGWGGLSSSYEAPGAARPEPVSDKGVWDALDRGDDPTA